MLEVKKYGTNKYGVWVIGTLKYQGLEFNDIFSTNVKDEKFFENNQTPVVKNVKISKSRQKHIVVALEF